MRVSGSNGASVPLGDVADITLTTGPSTIRTENAQLAAYIFVDTRDSDIGGYVAKAQRAVQTTSNSSKAISSPGAASSSISNAPRNA